MSSTRSVPDILCDMKPFAWVLAGLCVALAGCSLVPRFLQPKHNIFSVQIVGSSGTLNSGLYLYTDDTGHVFGEVWNGHKLEDSFGGGDDFSRAIREAFRKAAIPDIDWDAHVRKIDLKDDLVLIPDGWALRIRMDFEGSKCDLTMANPNVMVHHYARHDELMKRLSDLFVAIETEYRDSKSGPPAEHVYSFLGRPRD
jgi:hypothetical protein